MMIRIRQVFALILAAFVVAGLARSAAAQTYTASLLHAFCTQAGGPCNDGDASSALVQGADGSFHGTTEEGGAYNAGSVFKITASGTFTSLHDFCSEGGTGCTDAR